MTITGDAGRTCGVVAGRVVEVRDHPDAERIWLALVDLGNGVPVQIVFGGRRKVHTDDLVPVAPPGSRLSPKAKKMRRRRYRGESSYGMLCSLAELGWVPESDDEVALLRDVTPGASLDDMTAADDWKSLVINVPSMSGTREFNDGAVAIVQVPDSTVQAVARPDPQRSVAAR